MKKVAVDACLSPRFSGVLNAMYGKHGYEFIDVRSLGGGDDVIWADTFKRFGGEIVLSGDWHIAARPHEAVAFIDNGFKSFFPEQAWHKLTIQMQVAYISHQWGLLMEQLDSIPNGSCWRMGISYRAEKLTLGKHLSLKRLEIPSAVLDRQRATATGGKSRS